ncbi:hypothetical protein BC937DRAFT_88342 [Endogone sp. FLAS-F59071]|nr:hypothetical protein BC937DRAFT_88342 [Endogone sp. FLAS-F59071]|eukprot:RUS18778.1 hypothetical protein BC937DRAFT_88342 [Endogone sp. FLAS-F59071]
MKFTLIGHSRAADETGFYIPELCWALDAGAKVYPAYAEHLFITHTHSDHSYQMTRMVSRRSFPVIYVPSEMVDLVENYLRSAQELNGARSLTSEIDHDPTHVTRGVTPGESFPLVRAKAGSAQVAKYCVDVIACDHSCPTVGYLFYELRQKLLPEKMPISKELEPIHQQIQAVSEGVKELKQFGNYTEDDLRHWQNKLHQIDEQYKEGYIASPQMERQNQGITSQSLYEIPGEADVTEELNSVHEMIKSMLEKIA